MTTQARHQAASPRGVSRFDGILLLSAVALFCGGYAVAVAAPGASYSWQHNMVSDLGDAGCRAWDGRWICSPRAPWFNAGLIGSGTCVLLVTARMVRRWAAGLAAGMASLGVGLILLAAFPSDIAPDVHLVGAVLTLPVPGAGLLISGVVPATPWLRAQRWWRVALGGIALALCLGHLVPALAVLPPGTSETVAVAAIIGFLTTEGRRCWGAPPGAERGRRGLVERVELRRT